MNLKKNLKSWMMKKRELEQDLLSPKYKQRIEKTKKARLNEQKEKESKQEIRAYIRTKGRQEET